MLKAGIIQPSDSEYSFPALLVKKAEQGSYRVVVDLHALNRTIRIPQCGRIPIPDEIFQGLAKVTHMPSLDMTAGYFQISLHPEDRHKTAFSTWTGHYEYVRMPMGLSTSSGSYMLAMQKIFASMLNKTVWCYLDDCLVTSEGDPEGDGFLTHLQTLQSIFDLLKKDDIKAKLRKCHFLRKELPFLGYLITTNGLKLALRKSRLSKTFLSQPISPRSDRYSGFFLTIVASRKISLKSRHPFISCYKKSKNLFGEGSNRLEKERQHCHWRGQVNTKF